MHGHEVFVALVDELAGNVAALEVETVIALVTSKGAAKPVAVSEDAGYPSRKSRKETKMKKKSKQKKKAGARECVQIELPLLRHLHLTAFHMPAAVKVVQELCRIVRLPLEMKPVPLPQLDVTVFDAA